MRGGSLGAFQCRRARSSGERRIMDEFIDAVKGALRWGRGRRRPRSAEAK
jgi:hypothetical protein